MPKAISKLYSQFDAHTARLHVLGGIDLRDTDGQPIELKARKSRQLLAYLAVPPGQIRSRDQLASLLWSDRQDEQARGSLRTALSGIRRAIGDDALIVEQDTVRLREGYLHTDYDQLKDLCASDDNISKLEDFYSGEFIAGQEHDGDLYMEWLRGLRSECADMALSVLEGNSERLAAAGENKAAIDLMRESLSLEPLKEQTHRTIMKLYAASGEKAMALAQFKTCKEVLLHELDAGPDPETQALADTIALRDVSISQELRKQASRMPETPAQISSDDAPSIAVLPFVNMSGDAEQSYFADGITEDIIIDLSGIENLSVASKGSSSVYRGAAVSPESISQELGVQYLLEGSVRKSGDKVRISALLIDAINNRQIWAKRYDRALANIFELQSEISNEIVNALKINLNLGAKDQLNAQTTTSAEAYQYFLHAKSLRKSDASSNSLLAATLFKRAVAVDPNYALAYAELARCECNLVSQLSLSGVASETALAEAQEHCDRAMEIDPTLVEAHLAQGSILASAKKSSAAKESYLKALALQPRSADVLSCLGYHYISVHGDIEAAYSYAKQAYAIDPDRTCGAMLLTCLNGLDKPKDMEVIARQVLRVEKRRSALDPYNFSSTHLVAYAAYLLGDIEEAKHWTNIATAFDLDHHILIYNLACLHSLLGSVDAAFATLQRSLDLTASSTNMNFAKNVDPDLEPLRKDPRFNALFARYEN